MKRLRGDAVGAVDGVAVVDEEMDVEEEECSAWAVDRWWRWLGR